MPDPPSPVTQASLDHVVLLAPQLSREEACFREMGFQVTGGGTHAGGATGNRLVGLSDDSYLELLTFLPAGDGFPGWEDAGPSTGTEPPLGAWPQGDPSAAPPVGLSTMATRFWQRARFYGPIFDLALCVPDLESVIRGLRAEQIAVDDAVDGRRTRDDGVELAWTMAFPRGGAFPFLIQDLTPREHRVPQGPDAVHANGVTGIAQIRIPILPENETRLAAWSSVLGLPVTDLTDHKGGWEVMVGGVRLTFHPTEEGNQDHGPRYGIVLRRGDGEDSARLVPTTGQDMLTSTRSVGWELQAVATAG